MDQKLTITCPSDNSVCTHSDNFTLFSESNIYPGFVLSKKLNIINQRNTSCNLSFKIVDRSNSSKLTKKININVGNLEFNLFDLIEKNKSVNLGEINGNSSKDFVWLVSLDKNLGNEYQNLKTNFDINFQFLCNESTTSSSIGSIAGASASKSFISFLPYLLFIFVFGYLLLLFSRPKR